MKSDLNTDLSGGRQMYFDELAKSWELKYALDGSMVDRPKITVEQLKKLVPIGGRILDFGCGAGDIAVRCGIEGYEVDAVDRSTKMIDRAKARFRNDCVNFNSCSDTGKLQYADGTFDGIVVSSVLEYVDPLQPLLEELLRVCVNGGKSLITVPNLAHPIRWLESIEKGLGGLIRRWLPDTLRERRDYLALSVNRFSFREWKELFTRAGWTVIATEHRSSPLLMIVAQKGAAIAANCSKPV